MASLGNIWFDLNLKDNTAKDLEKIIKELGKKDIKLDVSVDKDKLSEALSEATKESAKSSKNFVELAKTLGVSAEQAQALVENMKKADAAEISILNNTERLTKAKERLLELERAVHLRQIEQTVTGKKILDWTFEAKKTLEAVDITDKTAVIKAAGADLSAQINIRKDMMRHTTKSINEQNKANRSIENSNLSIEKALLRIQKIRDRIKNDPFREQEGYKGVNAELDKIKARLESIKGVEGSKTKRYLAVGFNEELQGVENLIKKQDQLYRVTHNQTSLMGRMWGQMGNQIKGVLSIYALQRFTRQLIEMGGEFEKQHYALRAIIGDMGKADQIFNNLKKVAVKSPFHFGDFTNFAKQLAAFSIPVNEIYDTTKRLADVSAGLGVDMSRIILAYGQIRSASFLRGQEVRQLTEAGIPIIEELSKKLTELRGQVVSTSEVFDAISRREVPFEMVKEVFKEMTDEGGKFYNMQEILAESLSGKWANLTSHYQIMLYDMAQSNRGFLHGLIEVLTKLVVNFKAVESAILGVIVAYGARNAAAYVAKLRKEGIAWANMAKEIAGAGKSVVNFTNVVTASAFVIAAGISYIYRKSNEYNDKINEIISSTFELTDKIRSQIGALKDLASASDDNKATLVERERILNKIAETEPDVARKIRGHADDVRFLTDTLIDYVAAKEAARDIDLQMSGDNWYSDNLEDIEKNLDKHTGNLTKLNLEYRRNFAELEKDISSMGVEEALTKHYSRAGSRVVSEVSRILDDVSIKAEEKFIKINRVIRDKNAEDKLFGPKTDVPVHVLSKYAKALKKVQEAEKDFNDKVAEAAETMDLSLAFKLKNEDIKEGTQQHIDLMYNAIQSLNGMSERFINALFGAKGINPADYEKNLDALDGWRKEIAAIIGSIVTISKEDSVETVISNISGEIDNIKKSLEGVDIAKLRAIVDGGGGTDAQKEVVKHYDAQTLSLEKLIEAKKRLGILDKGGTTTSNKDPYAEKMSNRVKLIEDAKTAYEKYIPLLGKANALEAVRGDERYSALDFDPSRYKASLEEIYNKLGNTDAQKKLKDQLEKTFSDIDFDKVKEGVDGLTNDLTKYIADNKDRWGLFDKLFEQTGNYKASFTLAFGTESDDEVYSYIDSLKNKVKEVTSEDDLGLEAILGLTPAELEQKYSKPIIGIINDLKTAIKKAKEDVLLSDAKAIASVATLSEQAEAIRGKYDKDISSTDNEKAKAAYMELMNNELSDLYSKAIQLNPIWRELFGDVSDYSYGMLKNLVSEAENLLGTATEIKDKDGKGTGMFSLKGSDGEEYNLKAEEYTRMLKAIAKKSEEIRKRNPFDSFAKAWKDFINADSGDDKTKALVKLLNTASLASSEVSEIASSFSDMFDSLGNDKLADTIGLIGELTDSLGGIAEGFAQGGVIGGVTASLSAIPKIIGSIAKNHDKKLDRKIQKSANEVKKLQNAYENVNREIERQLGAMTKGQVDKQIASLKGQVVETQKMMENERRKKKSDQGKIDDYGQQIKELNDQIAFFYEDLANKLYGIDIKDWANQFSSTIMDAWRKGGDAALAYEQTANEVLASIANKMVAQAIFEPVFEQLRKKLPDMLGDGSFSKEDLGLIAELLVNAGDQWEGATTMLDELNEIIKEMSDGKFDLKFGDDMESNLGQGIQSLTEDTAQLLASYLNAIRQDVSVKRELLTRIAEAFDGSIIGNIAGMAADIKKIEANTFRSANGVDSINDKFESIINGTKSIYTS